jgi:hypothetical protein
MVELQQIPEEASFVGPLALSGLAATLVLGGLYLYSKKQNKAQTGIFERI